MDSCYTVRSSVASYGQADNLNFLMRAAGPTFHRDTDTGTQTDSSKG